MTVSWSLRLAGSGVQNNRQEDPSMRPYQSPSPSGGHQAERQEQTPATEEPQEARKDLSLAYRLLTKAGLAKEIGTGMLAAVCTLGITAMNVLFDEEVAEHAGAKGKHNQKRHVVRHGFAQGEVTLGGRRIAIPRPRMRSADGRQEIPLQTYLWATGRDVLNAMTYQRVMVGVSMRNYALTLEPVAARDAHRPRSISSSSVSRRFIELTRQAWEMLMARDLRELRPVVLMIDGIHVFGRMMVVAMVIDVDGYKHPVGLIAGATENARVVTDLLTNLRDRGLDSSQGLLVVMDGSKALAAAVKRTFGDQALIQRCIEHKIRNVEDYLHKEEAPFVTRTLRKIYKRTDPDRAHRELLALVERLEETNIDAANSLREGLEETLTIHRLRVGQTLARTVRTTNPIESMNEIIRTRTRNVKRWRDGDMRQRWVAAALLEAESQFRRVQGWKEIKALAGTLYRVTVLKQPLTGGDLSENAA
jgi:putative transposase